MEIFKPILGYPDYEISNKGNVRSLDRIVFHPNGNLNLKGKPLKMRIKNYGYVSLTNNGVSNNFYIHRLVAIHFVPNPENKTQVNHLDGDKFNNNDWNLEWNTPKENINHAIASNLISNKGVNHSNAKISEKEVLEIRDSNLSCVKLSLIYKISSSSIHNIKIRKTWNHV